MDFEESTHSKIRLASSATRVTRVTNPLIMAESSRNQFRTLLIVLASISYLILSSRQLFKYIPYEYPRLEKIQHSSSLNATLLNFVAIGILPTDQKNVSSHRADNATKISKQTNTPSPSQCWRSDCPSPRRNHIILSFLNSAGWNDRIAIFTRLANLAGYLCANLHVPSPSSLLHKNHNNQFELSDDMRWSDFLDLSFGYNQTIHEIQNAKLGGHDREAVWVTSESSKGNWETFLKFENFTHAQNIEESLSQEYFVWQIDTNM
jgi:hypothetical protein